MNKCRTYIRLLCLILVLGVNNVAYAQTIEPKQEINTDDLGNVSDEFQELFFEALKQKAITNHDKAIKALEKCIQIDAKPSILYVELGKNYLELKQYQKAEDNFKIALQSIPNNRFILELLYQTYYKQHKYKESIGVVEKLVAFDPIFKEQLANLYFVDKRYDEALVLIDELNELLGPDNYRDELHKRIASKIKNPNSQINRLEQKIKNNPTVEQNYLNLIYLYSQDHQKAKAFEVAQRLITQKPKSELVHLALYKFYLDDNKIEDAIGSMKTIVKSSAIDVDSKYKVIHDFLAYIEQAPQYNPQMLEVIKVIPKESSHAKIYTALGNYYYKNGDKKLALDFYERGIKNNIDDFVLLKRVLLLQLDLKRYEKAELGSQLALELFPAQPIFYLINGVSLIHLENPSKALDILTTGIDYVIDDLKMESDFYQQISAAYQKMGNVEKATEYQQKINQLQKKS